MKKHSLEDIYLFIGLLLFSSQTNLNPMHDSEETDRSEIKIIIK